MFSKASELRRFIPRENRFPDKIIVFIHGIFLSGHVFYPMGKYLAEQGFCGIAYDYPTRLKEIGGHGDELVSFLNKLVLENPGKKVNLVTHSLGGIITRSAIEKLPPETLSALDTIVMVVPPNQGSDTALVCAMIPFIEKISAVLPNLSSGKDSPIHSLHVPDTGRHGIKLGIIGAKYDTEVRENYYHLPPPCVYDYIRLNYSHTEILFRKKTCRAVYSFLTQGTFNLS